MNDVFFQILFFYFILSIYQLYFKFLESGTYHYIHLGFLTWLVVVKIVEIVVKIIVIVFIVVNFNATLMFFNVSPIFLGWSYLWNLAKYYQQVPIFIFLVNLRIM